MQAENDLNRIVLDDGRDVQNPDPTPVHVRRPHARPPSTRRCGSATPSPVSPGSCISRSATIGSSRSRRPPSWPPTRARWPAPTSAARLKVAAANVLNYFNGDGAGGGFPTSRGADTPAEFARQRAKTIAALRMLDADVTGLDGDGERLHRRRARGHRGPGGRAQRRTRRPAPTRSSTPASSAPTRSGWPCSTSRPR